LIRKLPFILFFIFSLLAAKSQTGFIANQGQWESSILYKAEFSEGNLYIEENGFNYNLSDLDALHHLVETQHQITFPYQKNVDWKIKGHCLKVNFEGAKFLLDNHETARKSKTYYNYFLGNDKSKWQSKVPAFQELFFKNIYPKIDLKIYSSGNNFKYDIIVKANANPDDIKLNFQGAENIELKDGNLYITTSINEIIEQQPYAYQIINGKKQEVACNFKIENNKISYSFPNKYNTAYDLVIDPYIVFSRYSSSSANNFGYTATYDSYGNAYGAGSVFNIGYITTPGAFDIDFNGFSTDIGITKYTSDGLDRIYATYLGGSETELPHSIVVNSKDQLFVLGTTSSSDFPLSVNCFDSTFAGGTYTNLSQGLGVVYDFGSDLIISSFSEDGTNLLASTYVGDTLNDGLNLSSVLKYNYADEVRGEIFIDENDNCIITSCTYSSNFPTENAIDSTYNGGLDAVVFKMNETLTTMVWGTYLGGNADDAAYGLTLDINNNIIIAGGTQSQDFPVLNAFQNTYNGGNADGFISKIHSSGQNLISSSYYGTNAYDQIYFVDNNNADEVHIFGQTLGQSGLLVENAIYNNPNGGQFLSKFNTTIDTLIWSTRFGDGTGKPDISPTAFLVDLCNSIFISGWGSSNLGGNTNLSGTSGLDVTSDAIDPTTDNADFYFMVMRDDASSLIYASYFGGSSSAEHVDGGTSRFDKKGVIYQAVCAGCGGNQDFPTIPVDSIGFWNNNSSCNLGLVKYAFTPPSIIADFNIPNVDCVPQDLFFENLSQTAFDDTSASTFIWSVNDSIIESYHLNYEFTEPGTYTISLLAIDSNSCNFADSITKEFTIIGNSYQTLDTLTTCLNVPIQIGITPINTDNITYEWTPTNNLSSTSVANPTVSLTQESTYTLLISNGNCVDTFEQTILVEELAIDITFRDSVCLNDTFTATATNINNVFYQWEPDSLVQSGQGSNQVVFIAEDSMNISVTATNSIGCSAIDTASVYVYTLLPDISATTFPDTIELGESAQLEAFSSVVNDYSWNIDSTLSAFNIYNPEASPLETTTYTVNVFDGYCPNKTDVTVYVILPPCIEDKIFVPNAFSPNNDGNNDVFKVRNTVPIDDFYFTIYDRWGQQVFETKDSNEGWDGTFEGEKLSPAAFAWYCSGLCENGEEFFIKGNVTILR